jgi:hypothetical protein
LIGLNNLAGITERIKKMGELLIDCPVCGIELRYSIYKTHICLGEQTDDLAQLTDFLLELQSEEEYDC